MISFYYEVWQRSALELCADGRRAAYLGIELSESSLWGSSKYAANTFITKYVQLVWLCYGVARFRINT